MLLILLGVLILHLIILILLIVSTAASAWSVDRDGSTDLWYSCMTTNGGYQCKPASNEDWIQAVQAFMILSLLFCCLSLIAFLYQLFRLVKGGRFFFTCHLPDLDKCVRDVRGDHLHCDESGRENRHESYGYAYGLAWAAFPLSLISGLIYIVLRKKE
ncbi:hypothetical protein L3Q82_014128 [Scortum barcoo]|uniref:Uncharacterized protein n=1 Tax=Scortum barcoo TaxID=214431 RepID=A0ACB8VVY2_9TELE|nr:hypothetical protein L3Q82_014128 [Scortum barcoo]